MYIILLLACISFFVHTNLGIQQPSVAQTSKFYLVNAIESLDALFNHTLIQYYILELNYTMVGTMKVCTLSQPYSQNTTC